MKKILFDYLILVSVFISVNVTNVQWIKTNGPSGSSGSVISIAIDSSYIFAVSNGYIYRSTDKGNSWSLVYYTYSGNFSISSLTVNRFYIYAGTNRIDAGFGIYRSSDYGLSWTSNFENNRLSAPYEIYSSAIVNDSVILACSAFGAGSEGMFRSTDYGTTLKLNNNVNRSVLCISAVNADC